MTDDRTEEQKKADEAYYDNFLGIFPTAGWKQLIDQLAIESNQLNEVATIESTDALYFRKGQLNILANILNLENTVRNALDMIEAENSNEDN